MKTNYTLLQIIIAIVALLSFKLALAVIPPNMNYQGHLTDSAGVPIDGPVNMVFSIYLLDTGGTALWSDSRSVTVDQGVFSVELGGGLNPFPLGLFENPLWMGLTVGADAEMAPRRPISSTAFSFKADDANTLDGVSASTLDQSSHVIDTSNPHNVTASQTGALEILDFTAHKGDSSAHHTKTSTFPELSGLILDSQIPSLIARDSEIMSTVLANDGTGSTLNADFLDGLSSASFMSSAADLWVNTSGDTMTGPFTLQSSFRLEGSLTIDSGADIRIYDGYNGFRWYDTDEVTQFGALLINATQNQFQDYNFNRTVFRSVAEGIGIGTSAPAAGFAVTVPSLNVTANIGSPGTGSVNGLTLGSDQPIAANLYHTVDALRVDGPNDRIQYGSVEYIEDCGSNCTEIGWNLNVLGDITANGNYIIADGAGNEQAYIGGDGAGGDVQLGSANAAITNVALWNSSTASRMDLFVRQLHIMGGADLAEPFDVLSDDIEIEPGMIVSISSEQPGQLKVADTAYDRMVAGIVSGANGIQPGLTMLQEDSETEGAVSVALTGRVYALVDARYGAVQPGDMLTTSGTPGYAMKASDHGRSQGAIIGKAMTALEEGKGHVLVLVTLQ